jgi:hypothetical protein
VYKRQDKGAIFENLIYLKLKNRNPSYLYVDGIELDFITEDGLLIEAKYNSVLNKKQQKLFDACEAKEKRIVNGLGILYCYSNYWFYSAVLIYN